MKAKVTFIIAFASTLIFIVGCRKSLEKVPLELYGEEIVFDVMDSSGNNARDFLNNIYADLPNGFGASGTNFLDAATDDATTSTFNTSFELLAKGAMSPTFIPDNSWNNNYATIRKVNIFLSKIDRVPFKGDLITQRERWKAEARAIRAIMYFELMKRWGGVPLIGDKIYEYDDDKSIARSKFADVVEYIVSEVDAVKSKLNDVLPTAQYGRITYGAALSIKARTLLYAASPLFNGGNSTATGDLKEIVGYATFDNARWTRAATALKEIIDLNVYSLESAFLDAYTKRQSNENILSYLRAPNSTLESANEPIGSQQRGGRGLMSPSQNLVDAFPMRNGLAITDPASGYNPNFPYRNRDPRLDNTVFRDSSVWITNSNVIQLYEGGRDNPTGTSAVKTRSGYYMRKLLKSGGALTSYPANDHNYPIFRYADILLMYAEALNESLSAPNTDVYTNVQRVRTRAGLVPATLPASLTKEQMRAAIMNERRLELSFEEHRYWDLRRWMTAQTVLNQPLRGVSVTLTGSTRTYNYFTIYNLVFNPQRNYLWPLPYNELLRNTKLVQNPNW